MSLKKVELITFIYLKNYLVYLQVISFLALFYYFCQSNLIT